MTNRITKITIILIGLILSLSLISGIDEMKQREPCQAPIDQNEDPTPDGRHNPKVPIDDYVWVLGVVAIDRRASCRERVSSPV